MTQVVKSAQRVMEIFEFFAEHRAHSSVNDVCRALGYPQSSTSMLLHSLVNLGYLTYHRESRTFYPTLRIAGLVHWLLEEEWDEHSPLEIMRELSNRTGHSVVLGLEKHIHVLYIHVIQATNALRFYMKPGSLRPICSTAVGQALLSVKSDEDIGILVRRINATSSGSAPPIDTRQLLEQIAETRRRGYAMTIGQATPGAAVIAKLLPIFSNHPPMAIGIGMPADEAIRNQESYARILGEAISAGLRRPVFQNMLGAD